MRVLVKKARGFRNPDPNIKDADIKKVFQLKPSLDPQDIPDDIAGWVVKDKMWEWCIAEGSILVLQDSPIFIPVTNGKKRTAEAAE